MKTKVVHCKNEPYDLMIDRTTIFGNPFPISSYCTREESIKKYRKWIYKWINNKNEVWTNHFSNKLAVENFPTLQNKILGCWCTPLPCHGDVIIEYLEKL